MNCRAMRLLIRGYLKDELAAEQRQTVAAHLEDCQQCATVLRQHRVALSALAGLPASRPSPRVRAALYTAEARNADRRDLLRHLARAAALSGAGIGGVVLLGHVATIAERQRAVDRPMSLAAPPMAPTAVAASGQAQQHYLFASAVELVGWSLPATATAGQPLAFQLRWRLLQSPPAHVTMFLHLLSSDGRVVAQLDRALVAPGILPPPGQSIATVANAPLALPANLPVDRDTWPRSGFTSPPRGNA